MRALLFFSYRLSRSPKRFQILSWKRTPIYSPSALLNTGCVKLQTKNHKRYRLFKTSAFFSGCCVRDNDAWMIYSQLRRFGDKSRRGDGSNGLWERNRIIYFIAVKVSRNFSMKHMHKRNENQFLLKQCLGEIRFLYDETTFRVKIIKKTIYYRMILAAAQ